MIKKLFDSFQPSNYQLSLAINKEQMTFSGSVTIVGALTAPANTLELHAKELEITSSLVDGRVSKTKSAKQDVLQLISEQQLSKGDHTVEIVFSGKITDQMHGMYPCYFEHEGKKKMLIATQFESHHAREVFPCIDEPAAKATFDVTLETAPGETVLGNTPVKNRSEKNKTQVTTFEQTPRMSPYLLAFVTGEMVSRESKTKSGIAVRSWASAAQAPELLEFSVNEAVAYIDFYEDYFNVPYPLAKCDQVALPDFESGAMENWGLITYREAVMLHNPENPSLSTQQLIAIVTAHELAHQWFGNLVTMQWWDDLWLNESFASMMEYIAVDAVHPEWQMWEEYVSSDAVIATNRDVYKDVQPVRVDVEDPGMIHTLFDPAIVYAKGGKLLKTLYDLLGDEHWRTGLKAYFEEHAYKNTSRDDLWKALSDTSGYDVAALMNTWLEQPGLPVVQVDQKTKEATVSQERLLLDGEDIETAWIIPLVANQEVPLLAEKSDTFELTADEWLLFNETGTGHFVTDYAASEHKAWVAKEIANVSRPSTWKIARINELIMLSRSGKTQLTEALDTISHCSEETRATVWSQITSVLGHAKQLSEVDEEIEALIKKFGFNLVKKHYKHLGWTYDPHEDSNTTHLRSTALGLTIGSEQPEVIQQALNIFDSAKDIEAIHPEIRSSILGTAVRFGDDEEIVQKLLDQYRQSQSAELRNDICGALTSARRPEQYEVLIKLLTDTETIRLQDTIRWFIYLLRNRYSREATWQWLEENWQWVEETFGGSKSYDDFARYSANILSTDKYLEKYTAFFSPKLSDPTLKRSITIGINEIKARVAWRKRDEQAIKQWFRERKTA